MDTGTRLPHHHHHHQLCLPPDHFWSPNSTARLHGGLNHSAMLIQGSHLPLPELLVGTDI